MVGGTSAVPAPPRFSVNAPSALSLATTSVPAALPAAAGMNSNAMLPLHTAPAGMDPPQLPPASVKGPVTERPVTLTVLAPLFRSCTVKKMELPTETAGDIVYGLFPLLSPSAAWVPDAQESSAKSAPKERISVQSTIVAGFVLVSTVTIMQA